MTGELAAAWSKLEGYSARFALLVHLIRAESSDTTLADVGAVDEQSIAAGVALSRWFGDEAARVYGIIGGGAEDPEVREQRELLRVIQECGGEITVRRLMQKCRRYRGKAEDAEAALGRLVAADKLEPWIDNHGGGRGRPGTVYQLIQGGSGNRNGEIPEETAILFPLPPSDNEKTQSKAGEDEVVEWTA